MSISRISSGYYIWGQFSLTDQEYLEQIQASVKSDLPGPDFPIHLTLSGPFSPHDKPRLYEFMEASHKIQSLELATNGYNLKNIFYQAFTISISPSAGLTALKNICDFNNFLEDFNPHISLYYGNANLEQKQLIAKGLPALPKTLTLKRLGIANVDEKIDSWSIEAEYPLS